jgi:hypothetical protein
MIKNLRYLLLSLLTIMSTATFAQKTVTIDFDNDYQALFPSLAGVSSSDSQDGDFTGVTNSTLVDGVVMVAIDPDAEASTPSRIWTSSPRLRMYSGSFTVISLGLPITKIEFNAHSKNFNLTAVNGTLDERVWTGSSNGPIFMVTKNTQISSIVVTLGEGGDTPDNPDLPISNDLLSKFTFNSGSFTDKDNQMVFDFAGVAVYNEQNVDLTGNFVFDLDENQICTKTTVNLTFPSVVLAQLAYLDTQANSEDYESVLLSGSTLTAVIKDGFNGYSKLVIKSMLKIILDNEQGGLGILESPMSPNQANVIAGTLEKGQTSEEDYYIKGKIASIKYEFSAQYGTATFFISADGQNDFTFQCYSVYYLENKPWVDGNTQIKVGDEVIICGKVVNYNGNTPETASKKAYIYSLNGKTKEEGGNDNPDPWVNTINVTEALAIISDLADGKTTAEEYIVKGIVSAVDEISVDYGNATFDIVDNANDQSALKVFRAKDAEGQKITNAELVKVGDEVVVQGKLQKYVKNGVITPEVAQNGKILTVNDQSTGIEIIKVQEANSILYNLAGQRVDANYKGVVIKNGQKMIQK